MFRSNLSSGEEMKIFPYKLPGGTLVRNTFWVFLGNGIKLVIQALYFVLIARSLGPEQYGSFVAVVAINAILAPFVGLGTNNLIVRNVARDKESFSTSWGNGLLVTFVTGVILLAIVSSCRFLLPKSIHSDVLLLVALADLILARVTDLCGFALGAVERFRVGAQINASSSLARLIGLCCLVIVVPHPSAQLWAAVYLVSTGIVAMASSIAVIQFQGKPSLHLRQLRSELGEGFYYSVGQSAQSIYNDIDKTMLARLGDLSSTGIYGAAYRIIDVTLVPMRSLLSAAYPGCFRAGQRGISGTIQYMRRLLPKSVFSSVVITISLLACAPILPHILGKQYAETSEALRWLALLPTIKTFHSMFADALTGAGHQALRSIIQFVVAIVNVLVNLWVIRVYSWRGAAWSSIGCDGLLACMYLVALATLSRRSSNVPQFTTLEVGEL